MKRRWSIRKKIAFSLMTFLLVLAIVTLCALPAFAAPEDEEQASGALGWLGSLLGGDNATTIQIIALLTILSLAPSLLIMLTGFVRIIIVLSFVRNAMGMQQMPPNQVLVGLALFLTLLVMWPTFEVIRVEAYEPFVKEQITQQEALDNATGPLRDFMLKQTYKSDMEFFRSVANVDESVPVAEMKMHVVIPAFLTSELKRSFQIGFFIYIPFIVMDMVVASVLMSMGMMMLPPTVISLPFKVLLFIVIDGWQLTLGSLINSFYT